MDAKKKRVIRFPSYNVSLIESVIIVKERLEDDTIAIQSNEYYSDMEVGEAHLNERLTQMGFIMIDGRMMVPVEREGREQEELLEAEKFEEAKEK